MVESWKTLDNTKLAELFHKPPSRGGVDRKQKDKKYVEQIFKNHFAERDGDFHKFYPLYKKKSAKWLLDQDLSHARGDGSAKTGS